MATAMVAVALKRIPIVKAHWADRQIQPKPTPISEASVVEAERPGAAIDKTAIVKNAPRAFSIIGKVHSTVARAIDCPPIGSPFPAAGQLRGMEIHGGYLRPRDKAAHKIGTSRHCPMYLTVAISPLISRMVSHLSGKYCDPSRSHAVNLGIASQKTARNHKAKG